MVDCLSAHVPISNLQLVTCNLQHFLTRTLDPLNPWTLSFDTCAYFAASADQNRRHVLGKKQRCRINRPKVFELRIKSTKGRKWEIRLAPGR